MKRRTIILAAVLASAAALHACGVIPNRNTSIVTVTVGDTPHKAVLKAEAGTAWTRLRHFWERLDLVPTASAYIPSVVQSIVVTVTAADISVPILGVSSVKPTDVAVTVRLEVPNGSARSFLVEGYRGIDGQAYYRGSATADLSGADVTLPVSMSFVGPGIRVDNQNPSAADSPTCGTAASPCLTITYALSSRTTGTDAILVSAGTYSSATGEVFPLQLKPNTALICLGAVNSTIIDAYNEASDAIYGAGGASVDNCTIIPECDYIAIDDTAARIMINGVVIDSSQSCPAWDSIMLSADSTVIESTILDGWSTYITVNAGKPVIKLNTLVGSLNSTDGISVQAGSPVIDSNTIAGMNGKAIAVFNGEPSISANTLRNNLVGVDIQSPGKPLISGTLFDGNNTGIEIWAGDAEITGNTIRNTGLSGIGISITGGGSPRIAGNTIHENYIGVEVTTSTGSPRINSNSIYCNPAYDVGVNATLVLDLRQNAWDHDATTSPAGPIVGPFGYNGEDIVVTSPTPTPDYSGAVAAPNGCRPYPDPVGKPIR